MIADTNGAPFARRSATPFEYGMRSALAALFLTAGGCSGGTDTATGNGHAAVRLTDSGGTPAPTSGAFDISRVGPGKLWTGQEITQGFGVSCPHQADAGGRPEAVGVALGMGLQDAISALACRYPEARFGTNGSQRNQNPYVALNGSTYGIGVNFQPRDGRDHEDIDVFLAGPRGEERVVGVWRRVYYQQQNAPLAERIAAEMAEKYGTFTETGMTGRVLYVNSRNADGQPMQEGPQGSQACQQGINFATLAYANPPALANAVTAGCGDTVAYWVGRSAREGVAGDFMTFLFNPTYGAQQKELSEGQAQTDRATRDAESRREAGERGGPTL